MRHATDNTSCLFLSFIHFLQHMPWFEGMDIGMDMLTPVDSNYTTPFKFTGQISKVTFTLDPPKLTQDQIMTWEKVLHSAAAGIE